MAKSNAMRREREEKPLRRGPAALRTRPPEAPARSLDQLIHERTRLGIVSALAVNDSLSFGELKQLLRITDGNLSVHARKLEDAGYILCTKSFAGRLPKTEYRLSSAGRKAFEKYLEHMESLIRAARER
ncbi:MAG: winged helix-turn-helix domain-containing protein [Steroidobacteraceae bacterium]